MLSAPALSSPRFGQRRAILLRTAAAHQTLQEKVLHDIYDVFYGQKKGATSPASFQIEVASNPGGEFQETIFQVMDEPGDRPLPVEMAKNEAYDKGLVVSITADSYGTAVNYPSDDHGMVQLFERIEALARRLLNRKPLREGES